MTNHFSNKFYFKVLKRALLREFLGRGQIKRDTHLVREEYDKSYLRESNEDFMFKEQDVFLDGKITTMPVSEYKRFIVGQFSKIISEKKSESILELGSGRGFNILALAALHPEIKKLRGLELSTEGVKVSKRNLAAPPVAILKKLTGLTEWEILSRIRAADIDFTEGSILEIPFPKNSFDAVFSNSVIEQIPRDYMKVFTGVFRVAEKIAFFSEPFKEAQRGHIFNLMHLKNIDYFCASYREVEKAGFKTLSFEIPPLQKFVFNTGLLVVSKI